MAGARDRLRIEIKANNEASPALGRLKKELLALGGAYVGFQAATAAVGSAIRGFASQLERAVALSANYEKSAFQLQKALELAGEGGRAGTRDLLKFAEALQLATQYTDDDIVPAMVTLTNIAGVTGRELEELTRLTADVAVTFNRDLKDAAVLVGKSARGVTDRMNELGLSISENITGKAARGAAALELLKSRSDGAAVAVGQTLVGAAAQLGSAWDTFLRNLGDSITRSDALRTVIRRLTDTVVDFSGDMEQANLDPLIRQLALTLIDVSLAILDFKDSIARLVPDLTTLVALVKLLGGDAAGAAGTLAAGFTEELNSLRETVEKSKRALLNLAGPFGSLEAHAREAADPIHAQADAVDGLRLNLEKLRKELAAGPVLGPEPPPAGGGGGGLVDEELSKDALAILNLEIDGYDALEEAILRAKQAELDLYRDQVRERDGSLEDLIALENELSAIANHTVKATYATGEMSENMKILRDTAVDFSGQFVNSILLMDFNFKTMIRNLLAGLAAAILRAKILALISAATARKGGSGGTSFVSAIASGVLASGGPGTDIPITPTVSTLPTSPSPASSPAFGVNVALVSPTDGLVKDIVSSMNRLARTHGAQLNLEVIGG